MSRTSESWRRSRYRSRYGITPEDYDRLNTEQGGLCALCDRPEENRRLAVDHDHETGKVRALLCSRCNTGLGNLRDDPALMLRAAVYVAKYR
ncbi:hypothetical protein TR51_25470 [Kitasatospora griseola]|uniref:Endonuclease VII n=1 Tax=Kitasatospora griseola TaxID=2064 RepID=A0A0D0PUV3_KITGR|nr:hypothetical protein TR51_25470 [Kitasatospora griseola]